MHSRRLHSQRSPEKRRDYRRSCLWSAEHLTQEGQQVRKVSVTSIAWRSGVEPAVFSTHSTVSATTVMGVRPKSVCESFAWRKVRQLVWEYFFLHVDCCHGFYPIFRVLTVFELFLDAIGGAVQKVYIRHAPPKPSRAPDSVRLCMSTESQ
jgi:hypothetical protein